HNATAMDSNFINILKEIDPLLPIMPSGAGHDAMILAEFTPTAMLFVRSPNGISHNPEELVWEEDIEAALSVVVRFIEKLANLK
ncbi:MAG TPA: M20/M25/M40 family metallo-hydrolase, partial [Trueperaceae bacterium]|nr:M20/M25/M40 family metallo-hydrolase [Trueperaceae bacterium]